MRMCKSCGHLDLAEEPLGPQRRRYLRAEHLKSEASCVSWLLSQIDNGHAAAAEFPHDAIAVPEGVSELGWDVAQVDAPMLRAILESGRDAARPPATTSHSAVDKMAALRRLKASAAYLARAGYLAILGSEPK